MTSLRSQGMTSLRYWTVLLILTATASTLFFRGDSDLVPPSKPLSQLPETLGPWMGRDIPIDQDVIDVLGKGDFLSRVYTGQPGVAPVGLFIGYFPTQRTGQTIHSPKNCLPGAGWVFESSTYNAVKGDDGKKYNVGEYVISNGGARQFVVYWYQAHGHSIANEYSAKVHMVLDAMRMNRTDGALIRVITPVESNETLTNARERALHFTGELAPLLPAFIPN